MSSNAPTANIVDYVNVWIIYISVLPHFHANPISNFFIFGNPGTGVMAVMTTCFYPKLPFP